MKAKVLNAMDEYFLSNPIFSKFKAKLQVGENYFRKMEASLFYFSQRLFGL